MNPEADLKNLLLDFRYEGEGETVRRFSEYLRLLRKWNSKMNLTSSSEWEALRPLLAEAFWAAGLYSVSEQSHLDIGSGAGFPALPMKILRPGMRLEMVESRSKPAVFLETVVRDLGLSNVRVHTSRIEDLLSERNLRGGWTVVSWKGLRLNRAQFSLLRNCAASQAEFWIFHGKELPLEDPQVSLAGLKLVQTELCPSSRARYLSIYK
jgi:16S rRNA (guanine(527)-N(7))-methyltransferase RsmG